MNMSSLIPLAPRVFDLFDNNRDGTVDMREILCGFSSLRKSQGDDALRLCFQVHSLLHIIIMSNSLQHVLRNNLEEKYPCSELILHSFLICLTTDV